MGWQNVVASTLPLHLEEHGDLEIAARFARSLGLSQFSLVAVDSVKVTIIDNAAKLTSLITLSKNVTNEADNISRVERFITKKSRSLNGALQVIR